MGEIAMVRTKFIERIEAIKNGRPCYRNGLYISPLYLALERGEVSEKDVRRYYLLTHRPKIGQQANGDWVIFDQPGTPFWYARFQSWRDAARAWVLWDRTKAID